MNTCLTVRRGQANSHKGCGWEIFTDNVIKLLNARPEPIVFLLWGRNARDKAKFITNPVHLVWSPLIRAPFRLITDFSATGILEKLTIFSARHTAKKLIGKSNRKGSEYYD